MKSLIKRIRWRAHVAQVLAVEKLSLARLALEREAGRNLHPNLIRIMATACWNFPIYSQTFVYQELTQLIQKGFSLRFIYCKLDPRKNLPKQFDPVWHARRKLNLHSTICRHDYVHYSRRMPDKVEQLVELLSTQSGLSKEEVRKHHHFLEAFAFTRMIEAYKPDYLHSYFFYEGTLFTMFASYLLGIPRGVSCYADHMLNDYEFKMVPVHLNQSSLVVATSNQIKKELLKLAPSTNPDRIIVKPNAINAIHFPVRQSRMAGNGKHQIVSVSRIERKKGLIYLAEAIGVLKKQGINVEWHHIGSADPGEASREYEAELRSKIAEMLITDLVHLDGQKTEEEIKERFSRSNLFIAPFVQTDSGDKDGIPTSLLEGMASGLPVVATDAGSIHEVVQHETDGLLVPQRDAKALAKGISDLLNDPERCRTLGENAARKIRQKFDVRICEQVFHEEILSVIRSRNKGNDRSLVEFNATPPLRPRL